ncbi:MAG: FKBP-type peptidyl-prolyl cis-trans isomerase [Bacteroidales bacterium]|nr:FKBP-type peptidyl-prolyl cis-trans isomerase [Bacteroidales bacterium]
MKKHLIIASLLTMGLALNAQNKIEEFVTSPEGVMYKIEKANPDGQRVKEGDLVIGKYAIYYGDTLVFNGFRKPSQPMFPVNKENNVFKGDLIDGLRLMHCGETTVFAFDKDTMVKYPTGLNKNIQAQYIFYRVQIDSVTTIAEYQRQQQQEIMAKQKEADSMRVIESKMIEDYLTENNWDKKTVEGIFVKHLVSGKGAKVKNGDVVKINYTGQLLDGKVFDTSLESVAKENNKYYPSRNYEPLEFKIGEGRMIRGFEIAARQLSKGGKAVVLLPSYLAYGDRDMGDIKPYSPLLFTVELVDISTK